MGITLDFTLPGTTYTNSDKHKTPLSFILFCLRDRLWKKHTRKHSLKHKTLPYSYFLLTGPGVAGTALLAALVNFDTTRVSARFSDFSFSFSDFNFCSCCKTLNYSKAKNISIFAIPSLHVSLSKPACFSERKNTNLTKTN